MKLSIVLALSFTIVSHAFAQYGYIITVDDSVREGFLRYQRNFLTGAPEIELWKTKNDKNPRVYPISMLSGYAIKKDTFKILTDFRPFADDDLVVSLVELKVETRGLLRLYSSIDLDTETVMMQTPTPGSYSTVAYKAKVRTYVIEARDGYLKAIDRNNNLEEDLAEFLDCESLKKELKIKTIKYRHVPELVRLHNKNSKRK